MNIQRPTLFDLSQSVAEKRSADPDKIPLQRPETSAQHDVEYAQSDRNVQGWIDRVAQRVDRHE